MQLSLPVLMYHSISRFKHRLCVAPELFEEQCRTLRDAGWRGITLAEAEAYCLRKGRLPAKTCLFTFDDGYLDNYVYAEPILRQYGHNGVLFAVAGLIDQRDMVRPASDTPQDNAAQEAASPPVPLPDLDNRNPIRRKAGYRVSPIFFASWAELAAMRSKGCMEIAPHSMTHGRVITGLSFSRLYRPNDRYTFFDVAPHPALWGLPRFTLGHGLVNRGYTLTPELLDLIKKMVPQEAKAAHEFLAKAENRQQVIDAVNRLPRLGFLETEAEYRRRIAEDFAGCRELFQKKLGLTPISFCWPWGSYSPTALQEARKAGFRVFFSTYRGINLYGRASAVRRFSIRGGQGREFLRKVERASSVLQQIPEEFFRFSRLLSARFGIGS